MLTGRVVDSSGEPLEGIYAGCMVLNRGFPIIYARADGEGRYSFTEHQFAEVSEPGEESYTCDALWFEDPVGNYTPLGWPDADNINNGDSVDVPQPDGSATEADGTLSPAGQLHGTVTDAKKRGLYGVDVNVLDATTRSSVTIRRTGPYGGFRVAELKPGTYKIKISEVTDLGYRPVYFGGASTFDAAKTFTVRAHQDLDLGTRALHNTKPLFTSRATPVLSYQRPLRRGTKVTVKGSGTTKPGGATITGVFTSRTVGWVPWNVDRRLVFLPGWQDGLLKDFVPFAGRRYVYVRTYSKKGYATTTIPSSPTVVSQ